MNSINSAGGGNNRTNNNNSSVSENLMINIDSNSNLPLGSLDHVVMSGDPQLSLIAQPDLDNHVNGDDNGNINTTNTIRQVDDINCANVSGNSVDAGKTLEKLFDETDNISGNVPGMDLRAGEATVGDARLQDTANSHISSIKTSTSPLSTSMLTNRLLQQQQPQQYSNFPELQRIQQLQALQIQAQQQSNIHSKLQTQQHAQLQAHVQAQEQAQAQANAQFYSIFGDQSYEKDNPLFTLANSVPYILPQTSDNNANTNLNNNIPQVGTISSSNPSELLNTQYNLQQLKHQHQQHHQHHQQQQQQQQQHNHPHLLTNKMLDDKLKNTVYTNERGASVPSSDWINQLGMTLNLPTAHSMENNLTQTTLANNHNHINKNSINSAATSNLMNKNIPLSDSIHASLVNYDPGNFLNTHLPNHETEIFNTDNIETLNSNQNMNTTDQEPKLTRLPPPKVTDNKSDDLKDTAIKAYKCKFSGCGKQFSRQLNYISHYESVHNHAKKFSCRICNAPFARLSDQKRHEKTQHYPKEIYVCGGISNDGIKWGCGRKFKRKDGLKAHWRSMRAKKKCFANLKDLAEINDRFNDDEDIRNK